MAYKKNIYDKKLPPIENFYSSLKLQNISKEEYNKTLEIYKKLKCKNLKDYLEIYMKLDICLQSDIFNVLEILFGTNSKLIVVNI